MNAKILCLALLLVVTGVVAQVPPAVTNQTPNTTATDVPDWSAPNLPRPARSAALTNRPPFGARPGNLPARVNPAGNSTPTAVNPPAGPATSPSVPGAAVPPGLDPSQMTIRPPATADTISDPNLIYPAGSIDWPAATLEQVLEQYSGLVGRNLLRPTSLNMKTEIVIKQTTPLTKLEVVQMIEAALYLNQISVINVGEKFVTVMPTADAFKIPGAINTTDMEDLPQLGSIITHIVQLKYVKPTEMVNVLQPFTSGTAPNPILPVDSSGMLVLRDNVANVKRMLEMIEKVDVVAQSEIISEVIPIKYAKAEEIASALSSVGGGTAGSIGTRSSGTRTSASRMGGLQQQGGQYGQPGMLNQNTPGAATSNPTPSSNQSFGDRVRNLISRAAGAGEFNILGETKIIADVRSNSLLVFATKQDMDMIKDIISKLDVVLAQVLIETIIMDVSFGNDWNLGVTAGQAPRTRSDSVLGGFYNNNGQLGTLNNFLNSAAVTNGGIFPSGDGFNYFGRFNGDLDIVVSALASDSRVNVIQKPRIQTSHATPANIFVGSTVPYISGTYYGGTYGNSSSYQQLRVGIGLTVTPFINQDGLVVMQIEETIDERGRDVIIDGNPIPETTSRTLSAEIAVRDRETILLGGFIRNSDSRSKSGVPLLKDIPLLGALFSSRDSQKRRQELIVLMRPTVLKTPELAALHVDVEKKRLPGIREAERDLDRIELQEASKEEKRKRFPSVSDSKSDSEFSRVTPFSPEDEKILGPNP